jgi:hypothetical protein
MYRRTNEDSIGVIFPTGALGSGFPIEMLRAGVAMGATAIAVDAGSTDSGPYYLGTGNPKPSLPAIEQDLRCMLVACREAGIPVVVGSCGTSGTSKGVDLLAEMAERIAKEEGLSYTMARIYSDQDAETLVDALDAGRIHPLAPLPQTTPEDLRSCDHIVGLMGHEPIMAALDAGADLVLAGRATDTSMVAAFAIRRGLPEGPAWHAAKTVECGGLCTTDPRAAGSSSPVYVEIDRTGFTVLPIHPDAACTPTTIAAHMLYENADPIRLVEPSGVLDTSRCTYVAVDDRTVRVEGSEFVHATQQTVKLEGSRRAGYETLSFTGIADPEILANLDLWEQLLRDNLRKRVSGVLGLDSGQYKVDVRLFGRSGVLGPLAAPAGPPSEAGVMLKVQAADQATATAIAKTANPLMLHLPLPGMTHMPSFAFVTSPAEIERGAAYEFVLNHVVDVESGSELFRTVLSEVNNHG